MARSFRILGTLGRGAFGEVHLTEIRTDDDFVQTLAVKWLHAEFSDDAELAGRLRDEARLLGLLDHPNIVRVQGLTRLDGRLAVLMEAVHGFDLSKRHLPVRAAAEVAAAVADALHAAWTSTPPGRSAPLQVVHRDIKPSNIMVTQRGQVKVMDFGVARATFETREAQTRSQQYGTARYMAPERWLEGIAEAPSDIFSLGVTLIELVSGAPVPRARLSRQGFEEDVAEALDRLPQPALRELVAGMLRFDPAERPDADTVSTALGALQLDGVDLRTWARSVEVREPESSEKTGTVVVEQTGDTIALTGASLPPTTGTRTAATEPAAGLSVPGSAEVPATASPDRRPLWAGLVAIALVGLTAVWVYTPAAPPPEAPVLPVPAAEPPAPAPTAPEPLPPEPVPEPIPEPIPEPVQPAVPAPSPVPVPVPTRVPPAPSPQPEPVVAAPERTVPVTFDVAAGMTVVSTYGSVPAGRGTLMLPADKVVRIQVEHPDGPFGCTLPIGLTPATVHVGADKRCLKR